MFKLKISVIFTSILCFLINTLVTVSPTKINSGGFGNSNNWETEFMTVFNNDLYVGTGNWSTGGEVWRYDGTIWNHVSTGGFGNNNNVEVFFFLGSTFNGYLYAGTGNEVEGGEVYRSSDGINWTWIFDVPSWDDIEVFPTIVFNNHLYVGSLNRHAGGRIWRSSDGVNWTQVNQDGFGDKNTFTLYFLRNSMATCMLEGAMSLQVWKSGGPAMGWIGNKLTPMVSAIKITVGHFLVLFLMMNYTLVSW